MIWHVFAWLGYVFLAVVVFAFLNTKSRKKGKK